MGLGKNLGLLQHDFNHFSKVVMEMCLFWGCFESVLGSDGGPLSYKHAGLPPWVWMRLNEESDWV